MLTDRCAETINREKEFMPVILMNVLKVLGSTLMSMALAMLTGPMLKKLIMLMIEHLLERYEAKAKESQDQNDDRVARDLRAFYEEARKAWEKI